MNTRYQPYRFSRCGPQSNCNSTKIAPYSDMTCDELQKLPIAMAYVPWQQWNETYDAARALCRGTVFPQLDLPFGFGG